MDRTSVRRPRRFRALLVAAALSASMFATALPAAAAPGNNASPTGWMWVR
jgi:hypothetical protein